MEVQVEGGDEGEGVVQVEPQEAAPHQVLAVDEWVSNAALIADVALLGYLSDDMVILDPTFGRGRWWSDWRPRGLVTSDLVVKKKANPPDMLADFTKLPWRDGTFDAVTFDPPYVSPGGRKTSTIVTFNDSYGIDEAPRTPALLQVLINQGLAECGRVTKKKGHVLVKCMNYVSSGKVFPGVYHTWTAATRSGLVLADQFVHEREPGMQPERTRQDGKPVRQHHARANYSMLLVFSRV